MKRLLNLCTTLLAFVILAGCENDIDINSPWRETPVVYGFLDPNTGTQYLRIQKTYQNSTSITTAEGAQINDSLYFDTILVKVKSDIQTVIFTKTTEIPKEVGYFSNTTHYLYKGTLTPTTGKQYSLEIFSPKTGNTYLSATTAIGKSNVTASEKPVSFNFPAEGSNQITFTQVNVAKISGAAQADATLRFKYLEYNTGSGSGTADTFFVDYPVVEDPSDIGSVMKYTINSRNMVNYIKNLIPLKAGYTRKVIGFDLFYIGASKEIIDLMEMMKPSAMVVQKKMEYSNISGGLGIFASRSVNIGPDVHTGDASWTSTKDIPRLISLLNEDPRNLGFTQ